MHAKNWEKKGKNVLDVDPSNIVQTSVVTQKLLATTAQKQDT